jgi:(p)ppGpp synthase/HD superfamily hydrolase
MRDNKERTVVHGIQVGAVLARLNAPQEIVYVGINHDIVDNNRDKREAIKSELVRRQPAYGQHWYWCIEMLSHLDAADRFSKDRKLLYRLQNQPHLLSVHAVDRAVNLPTLDSLNDNKDETAEERKLRILFTTLVMIPEVARVDRLLSSDISLSLYMDSYLSGEFEHLDKEMLNYICKSRVQSY